MDEDIQIEIQIFMGGVRQNVVAKDNIEQLNVQLCHSNDYGMQISHNCHTKALWLYSILKQLWKAIAYGSNGTEC